MFRQRTSKDHKIVVSQSYLLDEYHKATSALDALAVHLEMGQLTIHCTEQEVIDEVGNIKLMLAGIDDLDGKYQIID